MRASIARLAKPVVNPTATNVSPLRSTPANLLPPIPLYRRLLRAHRTRLRPEERLLGDQYIKAEFRAHRNVENPIHIVGFLQEWQLYAQHLEGGNWKDGKLDKGKIDKMSDEQIGQLWELMQTIQGKGDEEASKAVPKANCPVHGYKEGIYDRDCFFILFKDTAAEIEEHSADRSMDKIKGEELKQWVRRYSREAGESRREQERTARSEVEKAKEVDKKRKAPPPVSIVLCTIL